MSLVINKDTGAAEDLKDPNTALASGTHEIALVSPTGEHGSASMQDAARLIHEGYRQPTPEEGKELLKQSVYGTTGQKIKTALEGAAQGILGPAAPAIEQGLGVNATDIRNRQSINPKTHTAAELTGLVGSSLTGVGEGALLEKAGAKAAALVERAAGKETLAKIGAGAARGAVENAIYAAGNEGTKAIVNDPEQSAQTAIADVGLSAIFGGTLGGAFSAGGAAWDHFSEHKAQDFIHGLQDKITEYTGKAANKERAAIPNFPEKAGLSKYIKGVDEALPEEALAHSESRIAHGETKLDPFTKKPLMRESPASAELDPNRIKRDPFTKKLISEPEVSSVTGRPEAPSDNHVWDPMSRKYLERPEPAKAAIASGEAVGESFVKNAIKKYARDTIGASVGFGIGEAIGGDHTAGIAGMLLGRHSAELVHTILPAITKAIMEHPISGAGLKSAMEYGKAVLRGETALNDAAKAVFNGTKIEVSQPDIKSLNEKLDHLLANPNQAMNIGGNVGHYMSGQSMSLASTATNAARYLQSLRPDTSRLGALDAPRTPSSVETAKYNEALKIAQAPAALIMQKIQQGRLKLDDIHHMQNLYPALYKNMQAKLMNEMINHTSSGKTVPYRTKMALSAFMGQPLDSSMHATFIAANQPQMHQNANEAQTRQPHKVEKLGKYADSTQTSSQASESHKQQV